MSYTPMKYIITRDVTPEECFWLSETVKAGTVVYKTNQHTYGFRSTTGLPVTLDSTGDYPFFEIPVSALSHNGKPVEADYVSRRCYPQ
jgi:hypothetical protein